MRLLHDFMNGLHFFIHPIDSYLRSVRTRSHNKGFRSKGSCPFEMFIVNFLNITNIYLMIFVDFDWPVTMRESKSGRPPRRWKTVTFQ